MPHNETDIERSMKEENPGKSSSTESEEVWIRMAEYGFSSEGHCFVDDSHFEDPSAREAEMLAIIENDGTQVVRERLWVLPDPRTVDDGAFQITRFYDPKRCSPTGRSGDWRAFRKEKSQPHRWIMTEEEIAKARNRMLERNQEEKRKKQLQSLETGVIISAGVLFLLFILTGSIGMLTLFGLALPLWMGIRIAEDWKDISTGAKGFFPGLFRFLCSGYSIALWFMIGGLVFYGFFFEESLFPALWGGLGSCVAALTVLMIQWQKKKPSAEGLLLFFAIFATLGVIFYAIGLWQAFEAVSD